MDAFTIDGIDANGDFTWSGGIAPPTDGTVLNAFVEMDASFGDMSPTSVAMQRLPIAYLKGPNKGRVFYIPSGGGSQVNGDMPTGWFQLAISA